MVKVEAELVPYLLVLDLSRCFNRACHELGWFRTISCRAHLFPHFLWCCARSAFSKYWTRSEFEKSAAGVPYSSEWGWARSVC